MAIVSYNDRMRTLYPTLAHLYQAHQAVIVSRGRGKALAAHRAITQEHAGTIIGRYAGCGTRGHSLHYAGTEEEITCIKCLNSHVARK